MDIDDKADRMYGAPRRQDVGVALDVPRCKRCLGTVAAVNASSPPECECEDGIGSSREPRYLPSDEPDEA